MAAFLVVMTHAGSILGEPRYYAQEPLGGWLRGFRVGVDFFFVVSGFIIAYIHWNDLGNPGRLRSYMASRFSRVYPPYWIILIPLFLLYLAFPNAGQPSQRDPLNFVFSVLLMPFPVHPVLGVAWTLVHEMFFYSVFALLIVTQFSPKRVLLGWALVIIVLNLSFSPLAFPLSIFFNPFNLEFIVGVGSAVWLMRHRAPAPLCMAVAGLATFAGFLFFGQYVLETPLLARTVFGLSTVVSIIGFVELDRQGRVQVPAWLQLLGAASYSMYLVHGIAQSATLLALFKSGWGSLPMLVAVPLLAAVSVLAGVLYHLLVEQRIIRIARRALA
ncbi:acyltransferase [Alsobacter soli]|uniref:Acyltransferase n=2 Tax=Alsobacter soli TaxID=2109933 RepID=A0A2T1HNC6_9HYPH|nr:acyltransferase [Alsobacter soli]